MKEKMMWDDHVMGKDIKHKTEKEGGKQRKMCQVVLIACLQADFLYLHVSTVLVTVFVFCKAHYI